MYRRLSSILIVKQVAPLRQYHAAYVGGHVYVGKVMLGLADGGGGLGFGVFLLEHASVKREKEKHTKKNFFFKQIHLIFVNNNNNNDKSCNTKSN